MSKQTAVEWLINELIRKSEYEHLPDHYFLMSDKDITKIIEQGKAMEKQQSITDYCEGFKASGEGWNGEYGLTDMLDVAGEINAEQYYNETYKGGEQ